MNKSVYKEKKTFDKFDSTRFVVYLNEAREAYVSNAQGEETPGEEEVLGYAYTGTEADGGTLIEAQSADYGEFVNGLIRTRYSAADESSINSNRLIALTSPSLTGAAGYIAKWEEFQAFREECTQTAKTLLGIVETDPAKLLAAAIAKKIDAITAYDCSRAVNNFHLAGQDCWINVSERVVFNTSIQAAELRGEQAVKMPLGSQVIELPVAVAKGILAQIQGYADAAALVTASHKVAVAGLSTVAEVEAYDHTAGYPAQLEFNL